MEEIEAQPAPQNVEESADRRQALARVLALVQRLDFLDRQLILAYRIKNVLVRQFQSGGSDAK